MQLNNNLSDRIKFCIGQVGTQSQFLEKVNISRSQLARYIDGNNKPSLDKLYDIAETTQTDLAWLITGAGTPCKSAIDTLPFSYTLIEHVIKVFEETLMEYHGQALTPIQKSIIIPLIQAEMVHEKSLGVNDGVLDTADMRNILDYMLSISRNDMLSSFKEATFKMLTSTFDFSDEKTVGTFVNTICKASSDYFSTATGENYCHRTQDILNTYARKSVFKMMESMFSYVPRKHYKLLDMGCGSGRFSQHIHQNYDQVSVHGIEGSQLPYDVCKQKEFAGLLPKNAVAKGDIRNLPYENGSFDFVMSKAVLHWLPYIKDTNHGANKVFAEVSRVLSTGGGFYFDMRHGDGHVEYVPFNQTYSRADVEKLAHDHGFKIMWIHSDSEPFFPELVDDLGGVHSKFSDFISVFAVKI